MSLINGTRQEFSGESERNPRHASIFSVELRTRTKCRGYVPNERTDGHFRAYPEEQSVSSQCYVASKWLEI